MQNAGYILLGHPEARTPSDLHNQVGVLFDVILRDFILLDCRQQSSLDRLMHSVPPQLPNIRLREEGNSDRVWSGEIDVSILMA